MIRRFLSLFLFALSFINFCFADIYVGFGQSDITPPVGTPSAGYQKREGAPMQGVHDPLLASAISIQTEDTKLIFCSVDHLGYLFDMTQEVMAKVRATPGLEEWQIFIGSSHTHSGGGAFIDIPEVGEALAGKFDPLVRSLYIERAAEAIIASTKKLEKAKVGIGYGNAKWLTCYRATCPENEEPVGDFAVIKVTTTDDRPLACLFNFGVHPTILSWQNRLFSADFICEARLALKKKLGASLFPLFFNGAQGDVNPAPTYARIQLLPFDKATRMGRALAKEVASVYKRIATSDQLTLQILKHPYTFEVVQHEGAPALPIKEYQSELNLLVWNQKHAFVTVPGELSCTFDRRIKEFGKRLGYTNVSILGLTNDAHGYIITQEAWEAKTEESSKSWGGPHYGERIETKIEDLLVQGHKTPARHAAGESL